MKFNRCIPVIGVLFALLLRPAVAPGAEAGPGESLVDPNGVIEHEQADEREQARRLRRARAEHESRRAEAARKLDVEQLRQREIARLRGGISNLGRRESFLHHDVYWTQRELDSVSRDPADLSAMARRGHLGREIHDVRNQLDQVTTMRSGAMKQLDELRFH